MSGKSPRQWLEQAGAAERRGERAEALAVIAQAVADHPRDAALINDAGSLAQRLGEYELAEARFAAALALAPDNTDFAVNRAIALTALGRPREAVQILHPFETSGERIARYWSVRANAERAAGMAAQAGRSYDRCLALQPNHPRALHGRARIAIERGEGDAVARFDRALAANPRDPDLWLGKAQALDVAGDMAGARDLVQQILAQAPGWMDGLRLMAQLNLAQGRSDFAEHYAEAAARAPDNPAIPVAHANLLAVHDRFTQAADIATEARGRFPNDPSLALLEASYTASAGDDGRAEVLFAALDLETSERWLQEARHALRLHDVSRAHALLDRAEEETPWSVSGWALRGLAWRLSDDPRAEWLYRPDETIRPPPLGGADDLIERAVAVLRDLHQGSPLPLGQSLRGGTQTRGRLFDRTEPVLAELRQAIEGAVERYRQGLPDADPEHPLLRHRDAGFALAGSWSVRLTGGGDFHIAHIHPEGVISSALYLVVPDDAHGPDKSGWLELGRPPPDMRLDLPPIATIQPEPGRLALFPSYLFHGTTTFGRAERMTVAFDGVPRDQGPQN
ncbi:tetratricopeptide repeat protein [Erythrobacter sp. A6_0]|uniref:tetratricopeptide repeat protein n=1 Tax=Erythrobacter sp. A6_0 TaxID=2821089 RepID=UPI001ADC1024|nr:tetratricopeptide repeat protein [Erythrobacter sp. A6_0]